MVPVPSRIGRREGEGAERIAEVKALIFDFDGLVCDTETPEFDSWSCEFEAHGVELSLDEWIQCVGGGLSDWDVFDHLESLVGTRLGRERVESSRRRRFNELIGTFGVLPGVAELRSSAEAEGVLVAIASSSTSDWVDGHLRRLGLDGLFPVVITRDQAGVAKPDPAVYLKACEGLGVPPSEAVALEDSTHGVESAKRAGLSVIAVPNRITARFDLSKADLVVPSLADISLEQIREVHASRSLLTRSSEC